LRIEPKLFCESIRYLDFNLHGFTVSGHFVAQELRVLTIFDVLIFTLFEADFPFRFPRAVGENGKRNWEPDRRGRVVGQFTENRGIKVG
jgi:hypothetical protein